jgi:superfamily II DNA or RNA helicase
MGQIITLPVCPPRQVLRDYQSKAIEELRALIRRGQRRLLLVAPTGSGKTTVAAAMIEGAVQRGKRIIFLAHRSELIDQCSARLTGLGVEHGIIMANHPHRRQWLRVHVASVQTLVNREVPAPDLLFIDECHRAQSDSYRKLVARWSQAVVIGLTATPVRTDGRGLGGDLFQAMVQCPDVAALTEMGYLVPSTLYGPDPPKALKAVRKLAGDYNQGQLAEVMDQRAVTGDIVGFWLKHGGGVKTACFAVSIEHSRHLVDQFRASGVAAEHVDGTSHPTVRTGILDRWKNGQTTIVSNVGIVTEGFDLPAIECVIIARPTMSLSLYLQMAGRGLRLAPGKIRCLIFDHGGCWARHGLPDDPREWELTDSRKVLKRQTADDLLAGVKVCPKCAKVSRAQVMVCPCGYRFSVRKAAMPKTAEGDLIERDSALRKMRAKNIPEAVRKARFMQWHEAIRHKQAIVHKGLYVNKVYRTAFGEDPPVEWQMEVSL